MNNNDNRGGGFLLVVIALVLWGVWEKVPHAGTLSLYPLECAKVADNLQCQSRKPAAKWTTHADVGSQMVVANRGHVGLYKYTECIVLDAKNWRCVDRIFGPLVVSDGEVQDQSEAGPGFLFVGWWRYHWERLLAATRPLPSAAVQKPH